MNGSKSTAEEIFSAALEIEEPTQRAAYLDRVCASDADLRREVQSLLAAHAQADTFLESPAPGARLVVPPLGGQADAPAKAGTTNHELPGDRIGRYKLLEQIGEGGMGVVWMADQTEPVRRRVALKIIKLGMDTKEVVARFEAERQALALMDHPNIAKVFDGGVTEFEISNLKSQIQPSRPYFVMELVRGIRITEYCDQHRLSTTERLHLFMQVCHAVQHAHQKGIIHRDLKPSNVLVTVNDGVPVPKVIDFGIAKATDQQLTDKTVFTRFAQFLGTPAYMSPEQAEFTSLDIDTRSDVYSLGVLLYELLTGRTPFDAEQLVQAGLDEMRRVIREQESPRPSTRLSALQAADLTTTAQRRQTDAPKLIATLRGDLDWIVMKCLEKDRARRYETANGLALDLQRYLKDEPVVARPPSNFYRIRKLVRRNKAAFAMGVTVMAALLIGLGMSTWALLKERAARERAEAAEQDQARLRQQAEIARTNEIRLRQEAEGQTVRAVKAEGEAKDSAREAQESAAEAQAVLKFFQEKVLAATRPEGRGGGLGREVTIRAAIDAADPTIGEAFIDQPLIEASIRNVLGLTYGLLGDYPKAIQQHERSLSLCQAKLAREEPRTLAATTHLAWAYQAAGRPEDALPLYEEMLKVCRAKFAPDHPRTLMHMNDLAGAYRDAGRLEEAVNLLEETLKLRKARRGSDHPETLRTMHDLAVGYQAAGRPREALPLFEETLKLRKTKLGADHYDTLNTMNSLAAAYQAAGRVGEALPLFEQTLKMLRTNLGPDHPGTLTTMNLLAGAYRESGRLDEARSLFEETLQLRKARLGPDHPDTLTTMNNVAVVYKAVGRLEEALPLYEETLKLRKAKIGPDHPHTLSSMNNLANAYMQAKRLHEALPLLEETLKRLKATLGGAHPDTLNTMNNLAMAYRSAGRLSEALPLFEEALKLRKVKLGPAHTDTLRSLRALAEAYASTNRFADAEPLWQELLSLQREKLPPDDTALANTLAQLSDCLLRQSKYAEAEPLLRECLSALEKQQRASSLKYNAQRLLGWALSGQRKYAEAEPLMVQAYEGLTQREEQSPTRLRAQALKETGERLVQLYEQWGKPGQATEWKRKLAEPEQATPAKAAE